MKLKLDENLPIEILGDLRAEGHDAESVHEERLTGEPDPEVLAACRREGRTLLTLDKGIGDLRAYRPADYAGIVLFRPPTDGRKTTLDFVRAHLGRVLEMELSGSLVVVTSTSIRTR
jgi:predicted nuclease of predicted toxin-antitoxin system